MYWTTHLVFLVLLTFSKTIAKSVPPFSEMLVDDLVNTYNVHPKVEIEPLSSFGRVRDPKHYDYDRVKAKNGPLPDPVTISSSIRINNEANLGSGKQYENSSTIKRLNKRQILIQDSSQYLNPQATLTDGSSVQNQQAVYYTHAQPQTYTIQQDLTGGGVYGTAAPIQFQSVTSLPVAQNQMYVLQQDGKSYAPMTFQNKNPFKYQASFLPRAGEVVQPMTDQIQGESIVNPVQVVKPKVTVVSHADPKQEQNSKKTELSQPQQKSQQQIQYEEAQHVLQQVIKQQALQAAQQHHAQQFQLQQQVQQVQLQQQAQQQVQQVQLQQQTQQQQAQQEQPQQQLYEQAQQQHATQEQTHQISAVQAGENPSGTILLSPGTSTIIQSQGQSDQSMSQIFQVQQPQQQTPVQSIYQATNGQTYIINQKPATNLMEERQSTGKPTRPNNFVIRHQTYVTGPGGQMFTVPVPVPAEQEQEQEQNSGEGNSREDSSESNNKERRDPKEREEHHHPSRPSRPLNSFMRRVMDAFSVRGDAMERVETNIALPLLASTGVFFGLGALAAGWYLSNTNREVGILRRTGKPVPPGSYNVKRLRRQTPEVDQATFFQNIIQQAIEKQQEQYDDNGEVIPEISQEPQEPPRYTVTHYTRNDYKKPQNRNDVREEASPNSKVSQTPIQNKSWLGNRQVANFAKVAIPAIILGGAVLAIGALIFGWYITGSNREIAFMEPSAYSRRKRDLTTTALSDGWVQRVLSSIHENPYEKKAGATTNFLDPLSPPNTSKNNLEYHANLSDAVVAVSLAVVAFFSLMGIVLAWFFTENEKSSLGVKGPYGFGGWPNNYYRSGRSKRSISSNELTSGHLAHNPSFLESILTNLEVSQNSLLAKLQETGYTKWQETPCAKRIFCDVMSAQNDDTVSAMEKRMATFMSMLPETLSSSLSQSLGEVMSGIQRRDCSSFTCGGHWVDSSIIDQPSPPTNQPR